MRSWLFIPMVTLLREVGLLAISLALLIGAAGCGLPYLIGPKNPPPSPPEGPFVYKAEYDEVWDAAVESVYELGFVIVLIDKEEGFISTDKLERGTSRRSISVRLKKINGYVSVRPFEQYEYYHISSAQIGNIFIKNWLPGVRGRADYEWKIGDMISKKIQKSYVILKSGGPAGEEGVKDSGGK